MKPIVAISTPHGTGGIAVIRISGDKCLEIVASAWRGADLCTAKSHTAHLGDIIAEDGTVLDNAVATIFRSPKSFTGEDTLELSIHGSKWLQRQVVERLMQLGCRPAEPGEFTRRAFINGRLDLTQAEAVADLIASSSKAAHRLAMSQMSGSFSSKLNQLRDSLTDLASLLELELDFSEEDVEFADRNQLKGIANETLALISRLVSTYKAGRAFKEGVPVAIAGKPNAGKSTLLNVLLDEDKAIVSDIPGTTRDVIDDTREIDGILFRFYDTAGLRVTDDPIEKIGVDRAHETIEKAAIVLWVIDASTDSEEVKRQIKDAKVQENAHPEIKHILVFNKIDTIKGNRESVIKEFKDTFEEKDPILINGDKIFVSISAKKGKGIENLKEMLVKLSKLEYDPENDLIVTNARHHAALRDGAEAIERARQGLEAGLSADFIAQDIREAIHHLSLLTGQISTDNLLSTIFSKFCIGK